MSEISTTTVQANGLPIHTIALPGHPRADRARGLRRGRAQRAPAGERDGPLPRAPGVQGRGEVPHLQGRQRDRRAARRHAERLHQPRSRRLPPHRARRERGRGDRPALGLRRTPATRRRGARPRARGGDPGDQPRLRPALHGRRVPDRPGGLRRSPAGANGARPGGEPQELHARGHRGVPRAPLVGRPRRRVPGRQPRPPARPGGARRALRPLPGAGERPTPTSRRRTSRRAPWSSSATPTSLTCG